MNKAIRDSWINSLLSYKEHIEKAEMVEVDGATQFRFTLKKPKIQLSHENGK